MFCKCWNYTKTCNILIKETVNFKCVDTCQHNPGWPTPPPCWQEPTSFSIIAPARPMARKKILGSCWQSAQPAADPPPACWQVSTHLKLTASLIDFIFLRTRPSRRRRRRWRWAWRGPACGAQSRGCTWPRSCAQTRQSFNSRNISIKINNKTWDLIVETMKWVLWFY